MRHGSVPDRFSPSRIRTVSIRQKIVKQGDPAFASSGRPFFLPLPDKYCAHPDKYCAHPDKYCAHPDKYCAFPQGRAAERSWKTASNQHVTMRQICRHCVKYADTSLFSRHPPLGSPPDTPRLRMVELPYVDISQ